MNCARVGCDGTLRVTHTYTVTDAKFQRATCEVCGMVHRLTTIAAPVEERGEGAKAHAARLERGEAPRERPARSPF